MLPIVAAHLELHGAAKKGFADVVKFWIENGADVNATDCYGKIALVYGAREGHEEVGILLENGSDGNARDQKERTLQRFEATRKWWRFLFQMV